MNDPVPAEKLSGQWFVAVGDNGLRVFSKDGKDWQHLQMEKEGLSLQYLAFAKGMLVTIGKFGGNNQFMVTNDGVNWDKITHDAKYSQYVRGIMGNDKGFYILLGGDSGTGKPAIMHSEDGKKWPKDVQPVQGKLTGPDAMLRRFAAGNGMVVMVGDYGRKTVTRDFKQWENASDAKPADTLIDVTFGNGVFVGGGMHGLRMTSKDGLTWENRQVGEEGEHINAMLWTGNEFVGVGQGATYFSNDGWQWQRKPNQNAPTRAVYAAGIYVGSLWPARMMHSKDAVVWNEVTTLDGTVNGVGVGTF